MSIFDFILIGIGLSMDAAAISMTNGMVFSKRCRNKLIAMPLFFGVFQGIMPLLGFYTGGVFSGFIEKYSGIAILLILSAIGGKMIWDGLKGEGEKLCERKLTYTVLIFQAVITSVDAFAVGIGFSAAKANIFLAVIIIAIITTILSTIGIFIGKRFGTLLENKAEMLGGVILIIIGIKAMF